jgi:Fe-S-cluster containining protein
MSRRRKANRRHTPANPTAENRLLFGSAPVAAGSVDAGHVLNEQSAAIEQAAYRMRVNVFAASRGVGNAITSQALEGGTTVATIVSGAAQLSIYADQAIATIDQRYHPALDCKEGCSYCCRKPGVLASIPELLRILERVRQNFSESEVARLAERARGYAAQMEGRNCDDLVDESVPCPLLVDDRCSVYEVRPLVCRGYNSTDVNACRAAHENSSALVPIFALIKDVTDGTTVGAAQRLKSQGFNDSMVDLGRALNIALTAGSGFQEAVIEGDDALVPAENASWVGELWDKVRKTAWELGITI